MRLEPLGMEDDYTLWNSTELLCSTYWLFHLQKTTIFPIVSDMDIDTKGEFLRKWFITTNHFDQNWNRVIWYSKSFRSSLLNIPLIIDLRNHICIYNRIIVRKLRKLTDFYEIRDLRVDHFGEWELLVCLYFERKVGAKLNIFKEKYFELKLNSKLFINILVVLDALLWKMYFRKEP